MTLFNTALASIFGLLVGSFLGMLIPRLHHGHGGIVFGRSRCPHCKQTLRARDLIPLFSYLWLHGKCRHCREKIECWYPLTELSSALSFGLLYFETQNWTLWAWMAVYFFVLLFIFFYDLRYKEIHDAVMLPGIVLAFIASAFIGDPISSLIGAGLAAGFFALQFFISKGQWIGSGDIRIGAFMGLMLAWPLTLIGLLSSYILGSLISLLLLATKKATLKASVPLGPFLVLGTLLSYFWGDELLDLYFSIL